MQLKLADWIFRFVQGFRYEANKLDPHERNYLEPYVKEQMLNKPCQIEILQLRRPYRLALVFFFDDTKQDLLICARQHNWNNLDATVTRLLSKYSALHLKGIDLQALLERCRSYSNNSLYSIDYINQACCICFTHDPRKKSSPFPWSLHYISDPQAMAEMIFNLNLGQASMYYLAYSLNEL
jgi:hypothetical protein